MQARLSAFLVWALVAAGLAFWGLRLMVRPVALPAHVQAVGNASIAGGDLTRLFGAAPVAAESAGPAPAAESSRFKLLGVLAPVMHADSDAGSRAGVALIAVDGKPARPYAIGAALDAGLVLQTLSRRSASIGPAGGDASVVLELPPPAAPATGTLPIATTLDEPGTRQPRPEPQHAAVQDQEGAPPQAPAVPGGARNPAQR